MWRPVIPLQKRLHRLPHLYATLSKLKLSALVVTTTVAGFQLAPNPSLTLLGWTTAGIALSSFSANTFNQWLEAPFDSQMQRTRTRPLPSHQLSSIHAFNFGVLTAIAGVGILAINVGWLPALLSGANIILYAALYTPLKRISIANTWVGAVVGAIPPMIGFLAGGGTLPSSLILGAILYCWQFPHFNSLSWNLRGDYARAGYCMASVLQPQITVNAAWRHSLALIPLSWMMTYLDVCSAWFMADSAVFNLAMVYLAYMFRKSPSKKTARKLFFYSLLHLPILLILMVIHKQNPEKHTISTE